jgi:hypothetical protein
VGGATPPIRTQALRWEPTSSEEKDTDTRT